MRKRTRARVLALQALYQRQLLDHLSQQELEAFCEEQCEHPEVLEFALGLVRGTIEHEAEIDQAIARAAANWIPGRMAIVDRTALRIATYELLFQDDVPPKVSINEAIDIVKKFSTEDSGTFVNGILDNIMSTLPAEQTEPVPADPG